MDRRAFLKYAGSVLICKSIPGAALAGNQTTAGRSQELSQEAGSRPTTDNRDGFSRNDHGNVVLTPDDYRLLCTLTRRLERLQLSAGHGNFALMDFDAALNHVRYDANVGCFTSAEVEFMEKIFHQDARSYGFMGAKPLQRMTDSVQKKQIEKVPGTGNYLFNGRPYETYRKMCADVGQELILTSGIRGIIKQFYLFFRKAVSTKGNLSTASWSLAPPGYSYHGISDFDVGSVRLGSDNFTRLFTRTSVFKKLQGLDYVHLRYTERNNLGVRFEPWHIKIT